MDATFGSGWLGIPGIIIIQCSVYSKKYLIGPDSAYNNAYNKITNYLVFKLINKLYI